MAEVKVKSITYKPNGQKPGENSSGFDPFYGGEGDNIIPFPRDRITPWWEDIPEEENGPWNKPRKPWWEEPKEPYPWEFSNNKTGIVSHLAQMTENELRELYGGYLVPKGYREQDIMEMPIKDLEYLFNQVMNI